MESDAVDGDKIAAGPPETPAFEQTPAIPGSSRPASVVAGIMGLARNPIE